MHKKHGLECMEWRKGRVIGFDIPYYELAMHEDKFYIPQGVVTESFGFLINILLRHNAINRGDDNFEPNLLVDDAYKNLIRRKPSMRSHIERLLSPTFGYCDHATSWDSPEEGKIVCAAINRKSAYALVRLAAEVTDIVNKGHGHEADINEIDGVLRHHYQLSGLGLSSFFSKSANRRVMQAVPPPIYYGFR